MGVQGHDDVGLVEAARAGDPVAFGRLFDRWFDRTYDVAWHIVRNPDTAAEIAQDSFLTAWQQLSTLRQPASFGGWVLRIARNRSLNRLERDRRTVARGDETVMAVLDGRADQGDIAADLADQERDQLVWAAAAALGERDASLLDLHLRHDLSAAAIAEELDTSTNNVHQLLHRLRGRLAGAIRSWVLWKDGRTRCEGLAHALEAGGITRFGPEAVRVVSAHAADCDVCGEAQRAILAPEALFSAVPVVAAPVALKAQAASALMSAGVPLGSAVSRMASDSAGSSGGGGGGGGGAAGSGGEGAGGAGGSGGSGGASGGGPSGTAGPAGAEGGAVPSGETAAVGAPGPVAATGRAPSPLRALRPAVSGRRLVLLGAAVMALVAAAVTGVVLSDPAERSDRPGAEESDIAGGNAPGDDGPGTGGPEGDDPREIGATNTPTTGLDGDPGSGAGPGGEPGVPGPPGGAGGPGGGSSGPGAGGSGGSGDPGGGSGGSGGSGDPGGGSGGSDDPGLPPGGGPSTTLPGGPTDPPGTTTTSTPPDPAADPPRILAFEARVGAPCGQLPLLRTVVLAWASVDGESASLGLLGILGRDVPASGSARRCVLLGDIYLLTVSGPGGRDRARLEIAL